MTLPRTPQDILAWVAEERESRDDLYSLYGTERVKTVHRAPELETEPQDIHGSDCTCGYEGPDSFGNYDQIVNPDCPVCS